MRGIVVSRIGYRALALALCLLALAASASAQGKKPAKYGDKLIDIDVSEVTLEAIDFRAQTARMSVGLEVSNPYIPLRVKDFDYRLRLYGLEAIEGSHDGMMKLGGKGASRINLPFTVNLRSIPGVVWSAFKNRGRLQFDLDTGFTLPLYVFEKRFDQSVSGEVPLKSLVDAAALLRAMRFGGR
ncbi:MAG TPA: LEA type 2 family protein [Blastocatellia bacterium]|nr:LEA type 2 family protein [Blastocatellia bacterium]